MLRPGTSHNPNLAPKSPSNPRVRHCDIIIRNEVVNFLRDFDEGGRETARNDRSIIWKVHLFRSEQRGKSEQRRTLASLQSCSPWSKLGSESGIPLERSLTRQC